MPFCSSCGGPNLGTLFCGQCGAAAAGAENSRQLAIVETKANSSHVSSEQYHSPVSVATMVILRNGEACPICSSTLYSTKFTLWHFIVCVAWFPIGLLALLLPVKQCERGHSYGAGAWLVGVLQILLVLFVLLIVLVVIALTVVSTR